MTLYVRKHKILDKNCDLATVDRLFNSSNVELEDLADNPDNELIRFEFMELLVRIADVKFRQSDQTKTYSEAVDKLIKENIIENSNHYEW